MQKEKIKLTQKDAKNSPAGGVVVGKRNGQTMIYDDASVGGYFVGKTHDEGGIKMVNKSNGQPLEVQGSEVIITAPAVADQTKRNFDGKMMTNREILSTINERGGGVAFAEKGMEIPKNIKRTGASYKYGGKTMTDHEIYKYITGGGVEKVPLRIVNKVKKLSNRIIEIYNMNLGNDIYSYDGDLSFKQRQKFIDEQEKLQNELTEVTNELSQEQCFSINSESFRELNTAGDYGYEEEEYITGGHLADGMTLSQIAKKHKVSLKELQKQVDLGMKAESEHTSSKREQMKIVKDHLFENPKYYTVLKKAGLEDGGVFKEGGYVSYKDKYNRKYKYKKGTSHSLSEIAKDTGVSTKGIQRIYNKGIGAFKTNPSSVRPNVKSKEQWAMARVYSAVMGGKASKVDATELKMNHGGRVHRDSLVRDSKSGNTPARDLNNYNDVVDVQADNMVGAETGLFGYGGSVAVSYAKGGATNVTVDEWDDIPDTFKNIRLPKSINWSPFPDNEGLLEIAKPFLSKDSLRPALQGMNFDDNGITFTNSHILLTIPTTNVNIEGIYEKGVKNINATYPKYQNVIRKEKDNVKVFSIDILKLLTYCKVAKNYSGKNEITFKINDFGMSFNADYIIDFLSSLSKLGDNNFWYVSFNSVKEALVFTKNSSYELGKDIIGLIMPYIYSKRTDYGTQNDDKNAILNVYFDFDDNEIHNADGSINNLISKPITSRAKRKPKTTPSQTSKLSSRVLTKDELYDSKIWIGDNVGLRDKVIAKLLEIGIPRDTNYGNPNYDKDIIITIYGEDFVVWSDNKSNFDANEKKEIFESDLFSIPSTTTSTNSIKSILVSDLTLKDLSDSKIWFGDNPALSEKIQKRAFSLGLKWIDGDTRVSELDAPCLVFNGSGNNNNRMEKRADKSFFDSVNLKEIFVTDTTPTASNDLTQDTLDTIDAILNENKPFDLKQKKIWIGYNPALSERIQKRAFELGFDWWGGDGNTRNLEFDNLFFDDNEKITSSSDRRNFDSFGSFEEITEADLFPISNGSQTSNLESEMKNFDFSTLFEKENEDWVKKFTADLDKLVVPQNDPAFTSALSKEHTDLDALIKLLPSFQQSKYAVERAKILKEIKKLHYKLTYEGFIKPNEALSSDANLFTPQGLLDYYFTQSTQNPTAELEPACELITPNGEKSKLPLSAYLNVRTEQFKNWFGDWEKAYETGNYVNCSKMIDPDTKEPKIYFHGVRKYIPNFGQFSNMGQGVTRPYGAFEPPSFPASYFAGEEDYAKFYGGIAENMPTPSADYKPFIYKVFLSVKNPISLLPLDFMLSYKDFIDYVYVGYGVKVEANQQLLKGLNNDMTSKNPMWIYVRRDIGFIEKLKDYGYDALFQMGDIPTFLPNGEVEPDRTKHLQEVEYLTFYPSQVKSATVKKSFYFDFFNDIRFKNGGYVRI
jgi:hypothetical protein